MKYLKYLSGCKHYFENKENLDPYGEEEWDEEEKKEMYYLCINFTNEHYNNYKYASVSFALLDHHPSDDEIGMRFMTLLYDTHEFDYDLFDLDLFYDGDKIKNDEIIEYDFMNRMHKQKAYFIFLSHDIPTEEDVMNKKDIIESILNKEEYKEYWVSRLRERNWKPSIENILKEL